MTFILADLVIRVELLGNNSASLSYNEVECDSRSQPEGLWEHIISIYCLLCTIVKILCVFLYIASLVTLFGAALITNKIITTIKKIENEKNNVWDEKGAAVQIQE